MIWGSGQSPEAFRLSSNWEREGAILSAIWGDLTLSEINSINQQRQQKINRALVIRLLRRMGVCSRAELASKTGLQRATITNIIKELMDCGLVKEDGLLEGCKGRRAIGLRIDDSNFCVLGAMVARTHYSLCMMGLSGKPSQIKSWDIEENTTAEAVIQAMCKHMRQMIRAAGRARTLAICLSMPGPYKTDDGGRMVFVTNLAGWDGIPIRDVLQKEFDVPVLVENDANAAVCAHLWFRKETTTPRNMAYIVAGQGIGSGICIDGTLVKGSTGIAGEIGHTSICYDGPRCACGNRGCLEMYCSEIVLMSRLRSRMQEGEQTQLSEGFDLKEVREAVLAGDQLALEEYCRVCRLLAVGIVNLVNQVNPGLVIVGDSLAEIAPDLMLEIVSGEVKQRLRPMVWDNLTLAINDLPENPILIGACAVAAEMIFDDPVSYAQGRIRN